MRRRPPRGVGITVVIGEETPHGRGVLRRILESEGFTVLGHASDPEDLERILIATDPDVLVLDAQAGATTLPAARGWAPRVRIVVVWPADVRAEAADQHVVPSQAPAQLGAAVLKAARSRRMPTAPTTFAGDVLLVPDVGVETPEQLPEPVPRPIPLPVLASGSSANDGVVVLSQTDTPEVVGAATVGPARRAWTSLALAAACLLVAFVAAFASQPGVRQGFLAEPPRVPPHDLARPGNGGGGGDAGSPQRPPNRSSGAPSPPRFGQTTGQTSGLAEGATPSSGTTDRTGTRSTGGRAGDPGTRDRRIQRRHRRRHQRRHHRRHVDHNRDHHGDHGHSGHHGHRNGHSFANHSDHPNHGGSEHGHRYHRGNPHAQHKR